MSETALETIRGVMTQIAPVPTGIDPSRMLLWGERGEFDYEYCRSVIGASAQGLNEERAVAWGDLIALTTEQAIWYMNGGAVGPTAKTMGKSRPPSRRGFNAGHMIDLFVWSDSFGGDRRTLEDMTESQLIGSVVGLITGFRDRFDYEILNRALTDTHYSAGTSGYNVGWCDGDSSTVKYAPPKWNGKTFYEDHSHYAGYNSSNSKTLDDVITGLAFLLAEHGLPVNVNLRALISEADAGTVEGLANYVTPVLDVTVDRGGATSGSQYFELGKVGSIPNSGGRFFGMYRTRYGFVELYALPRIPTGYVFEYRPGEPFAANNALALRYRKSTGYGLKILEIPDFTTTFPVKEIDLEDEYGVGTGKNRYAGAAGLLVAGGTWADATLSL